MNGSGWTSWPSPAPLWTGMAGLGVLYLFALGLVCLLSPRHARRFFGGFATSPAHNLIEALARAGCGLGLMGHAPLSKAPDLLYGLGAFLVLSAGALVLWYRAHRAYAAWAVPFAQRHLFWMGCGALALGAGLLLLF